MGLSVTPPDPPVVDGGAVDEEYDAERRGDLQAYLSLDNAWGEAFDEWATDTSLTDDDPATAVVLRLIPTLDFYWYAARDRVEYDAPTVPDDWPDREAYADVDSWSTASTVDEELDSLGATVANTLDDYFLDWEPTGRRHSTYHEMFGDQFNGGDDDYLEPPSEER
ncbi:hypothetical protein [Halomarina rubra]|uniref:DUF7992 domain-containing protein n=1 Tax=Halomarina rubra TaxID=2071873 RepID=A0ABD6AVE2_9EURY|nr:hypothetical protein [Halomarina rubra]